MRTPLKGPLRNIAVHLAGGTWMGVLVVITTPVYVGAIGVEGYGVLSMWLLLQPLLAVFDLGLGAGLLREFSDSRESGVQRLGAVLLTLEAVYWPVALMIGLVVTGMSSWIAEAWLNLRALDPGAVARATAWMGVTLALQYPGGMYNSGLTGLQLHGRLNALQATGNGARFIGGAAVLVIAGDLVAFFQWQSAVAGSQTLLTRAMLWRALRRRSDARATVAFGELARIWKFSAGMAITMLAGLLLANVDRLFISAYLPADDLGAYSLAFTACGILQLGIQPFYRVYFPRFSELVAAGRDDLLAREYFDGCRMMAAVLVPAAVCGFLFSEELLTIWLGEPDPVTASSFRWLVVGVSAAGLMWLPAAFQQAHGWTSLNAGLIISALLLGVSILGWAVDRWGPLGATVVWLIHGSTSLSIGLVLMHRRLLRGRLAAWYTSVVIPPLLISGIVCASAVALLPEGLSRPGLFAYVGIAGLLAAVLPSSLALRRRAVR